jgi:hypothetical protein
VKYRFGGADGHVREDATALYAALEKTIGKPANEVNMSYAGKPGALDLCDCGSLKPESNGWCWDCWARKYPQNHTGPKPRSAKPEP